MDMKRLTAQEKIERDLRLSGVLIALGIIYYSDAESLAEEIVGTVGATDLLRVAIAENDTYLPNLRKTIQFLKPSRRKLNRLD